MPGELFITRGDIELRTIEREDVEFLQISRNRPEFRNSLVFRFPSNRDQMESFYESTVTGDERSVNLVIVDGESGERVGMMNLFDVTRTRGEVSYWVLPEHRQRRIATTALEAIVEYGFDTLGLRRIVARVLANNDASNEMLERFGFTREGTLRDHEYLSGEHRDVAYFGLLADEFETDSDE